MGKGWGIRHQWLENVNCFTRSLVISWADSCPRKLKLSPSEYIKNEATCLKAEGKAPGLWLGTAWSQACHCRTREVPRKVPSWTHSRGPAPGLVGAALSTQMPSLFRIGDCSRLEDLFCTRLILVYPCWREEPFKRCCMLACLLKFFSINRSRLEREW